jgi:hypothetical protein
MYHYAFQSKKSTLSQSHTPVSNSYKAPGLFSSISRKFSKITSRFPTKQVNRVDLTAEGLECLEHIFESKVQIDDYINLTTFLNEVISLDAIDFDITDNNHT